MDIKQLKEKARDNYKKEFGEPEEYTPRDRRVSQIANVVNGDEFAEALDDQYENFAKGSCAMQKDFYDMHIKYLDQIVDMVAREVCEEIDNLCDTTTYSVNGTPMYDELDNILSQLGGK